MCCIKEPLVAAVLISICEAYHSLSLYPPNTLFVDLLVLTLVIESALFKCDFQDIIRDLQIHFSKLCPELLITEGIAGKIHKPCCLNVVTVGVNVSYKIIVIVKEYFKSIGLGSVYNVAHLPEEIPESLAHIGSLLRLVELGVSLYQVEDSVHGPVSVQTVLGELIVCGIVPVAVEGLAVAVVFEGKLFNIVIKLIGKLESIFISCRVIQAGERIYRKGDIVGVLLRIGGLAVIGGHPVNSALVKVYAVVFDVLIGMESVLQTVLITEHSISL